ncbi:MAG: hypothetical protein M3Z21_02570 [Pseudomonadota bacterium]|nr:hypothetical protein [Pseudomonadota bacterium]
MNSDYFSFLRCLPMLYDAPHQSSLKLQEMDMKATVEYVVSSIALGAIAALLAVVSAGV